MNISYQKHKDIDVSKWDDCIQHSFNSTVYAFSWYLDLFCGEWDALVEGDYHSVMPLLYKRVLGRYIIYTPALIRELGVFSRQPVNADKTSQFLTAVPAHFNPYHILLNKYNPLLKDLPVYKKHVYFDLDLIRPYHKISGNFTVELRRKLNVAVARQLSYIRGVSPNDFVLFLQEHHIKTDRVIRDQNFRVLRSLMATLIRTSTGELWGVYNENNELASVALIAFVNNRIILLFHADDPYQSGDYPHLFLIDRIIDRYAETNSILSLEYSSDVNHRELYMNFGAREVTLVEVTSGKTPFYLKPFLRRLK